MWIQKRCRADRIFRQEQEIWRGASFMWETHGVITPSSLNREALNTVKMPVKQTRLSPWEIELGVPNVMATSRSEVA